MHCFRFIEDYEKLTKKAGSLIESILAEFYKICLTNRAFVVSLDSEETIKNMCDGPGRDQGISAC